MLGEAVDKIESLVGALGDDYLTPFAQQLMQYPHGDEGVLRIIFDQEHTNRQFG